MFERIIWHAMLKVNDGPDATKVVGRMASNLGTPLTMQSGIAASNIGATFTVAGPEWIHFEIDEAPTSLTVRPISRISSEPAVLRGRAGPYLANNPLSSPKPRAPSRESMVPLLSSSRVTCRAVV